MGVVAEDKEVIKNSAVCMWLETDQHALNTSPMLPMCPATPGTHLQQSTVLRGMAFASGSHINSFNIMML